MARRTSGWTECHPGLILLVITLLVSAAAGLSERSPLTWWVLVAVMFSCFLGLLLDAYGGLVAGLACAAVLVAVRQYADRWSPDDFGPAVAEVLAIVATGAVSGAVAQRLRSLTNRPERQAAAFGSLGLLPLQVAINRLDEELERARAHQRPLTLAVFSVRVTAPELGIDSQEAALRSVARIVEHRAAETDVPFAVTEDQLGLILPETDQGQAWERVGEVLDALENATFTAGPDRRRHAVSDATDYSVGIVEAGPEHSSAEALLEAALLSREASTHVNEPLPDAGPASELHR